MRKCYSRKHKIEVSEQLVDIITSNNRIKLFIVNFVLGLGFGLSISATFVALNSYFEQKRGQAVGLAMAGTALGFMAMPQVIRLVLNYFYFLDKFSI